MALTNLDELVANIGATQITGTVGDGAIGTGSITTPETYRRTQDGVIITQIKFDITGLGCEGTSADDVIGLESGQPDAYIGRYVVADCGIVFKTEMFCLEAPVGSATITQDIDITSNSSSSLGYNDAASTVHPINGATMVLGQSVENFLNTMAANDYLYITEADTAGTTGTYSAGMYVFTMYGHAALS